MTRRQVFYCVVSVLALVVWHTLFYRGAPGNQKKKIPYHNHHDDYNNTLMWAVKLQDNYADTDFDAVANQICFDLDLVNLGQVGDLDNHFLLAHKIKNEDSSASGKPKVSVLHNTHEKYYSKLEMKMLISQIEDRLDRHSDVKWHSHQKVHSRRKRWIQFTDPYYKKQWHLTNTMNRDMDINVTGIWGRNITGHGVTVAVVDDGLEWNNPDILANYNAAGSWDLNADDDDPMPDASKESNHHGTRCAGEIAAVPNHVCGVGVAYGAKVSGLRVLDGPMTDSLEATAFTKFFQVNDIYSCSWGPDDDGKTVDGPHILASAAMKYGIDFGRHGYGSIFVVASGNGGQKGDNCNYDGYANSIYTITIGAVDETGHMPYYSEECASMLAVTFSSGSSYSRDIVTTDWTMRLSHARSGCTEHHTGTSAAAPIAAGLIALMLQVQPCLTWRDVQYIIILTAQKVDIDEAHWQRNGARLWHSHKHGFGLMKAWRLVNAALVWSNVPWQTQYMRERNDLQLEITKGVHTPLQVTFDVTEEQTNAFDLYTLETVQVSLTLNHPCRGFLEVKLKSPHGTVSVIGASRPHDNTTSGFDGWVFSTVRCWGETPHGTWLLTITDKDKHLVYGPGYLKACSLKLYGTPMTAKELQHRRRIIEDAMDGRYINRSTVCSPAPVTTIPARSLSQRTLKVLALVGAFCIVMVVYESLEYLLCYNDEKKEYAKVNRLVVQAHRLARQALEGEGSQSGPQDPSSESTGLLAEHIPMQTLHGSDLGELNLGSRSDSFHEHDLGCTSLSSRSESIHRHDIGELNLCSTSESSHGHDLENSNMQCNGAGANIDSVSETTSSHMETSFNTSESSVQRNKHNQKKSSHRKRSKKSGYTLLPESSDESDENVLFENDRRTLFSTSGENLNADSAHLLGTRLKCELEVPYSKTCDANVSAKSRGNVQ